MGGVRNFDYFNVVDFFEKVLSRHHRGGPIQLDLYTDRKNEADPAYVTFRPRTLHVHEDIWELAKLGGAKEREIIGHEFGHLVFHDHTAKAFSDFDEAPLKSVQKEEQAEWQAITFADHFLLPNEIVERAIAASRVADIARVPLDLAQRRFAAVRRLRQTRRYQGEACTQCANFSLVSEYGRVRCTYCGARS